MNVKTRFFALEMIEDGKRKWFIENIPLKYSEIPFNNKNSIGHTIIEYNGIDKFANEINILFYELNSETNINDWKDLEKIKNKLISINILKLKLYL